MARIDAGPSPSVPLSQRRRMPWQSPPDQPRYARPALLAIIAVAGALFVWGINRGHYHMFYANAVHSMAHSWKAFFFGSFDPGNSITLDKLPGFLWPQALSARIFGFHPWALALPQVIEGVLGVLVLYRVVRRWAGANAALAAAAIFTLTPVVAGVFRSPAEDGAFTLLLLLAADACGRATRTARGRALALSGVWVGLAFQAKMLEAWVVLPALAVTYLIAAPAPLRRRLLHLGAAGAVTVAVSASWTLAVSAVPAHDRPYVDGTTDNSALSMVVGYNFLNRFDSIGLTADGTGSVTGDRTRRSRARSEAAPPASADPAEREAYELRQLWHRHQDDGWGKMFGPAIASQTGWMYPMAVLALAAGLAWRRRRPRTDPVRAGYVLWGLWLGLFVLVFSAGSVGGHMYYMGVVAVPLAALSGAGLCAFWRAYRDGGRRARALPIAVAATAAWCAYLTWRFPAYLPWLGWTVAGLGAAALALLARGRRAAGRSLTTAGAIIAAAAILLAPAAWVASVLGRWDGGSGIMGSVGPLDARREALMAGLRRLSPDGGGPWSRRSGALTAGERGLLRYLWRHRDGARYLFAASSWHTAAPYILGLDTPVLPMGGFTGHVPFPRPAEFRRLVAAGQVRYVLAGAPRHFGPPDEGTTPTTQILSWVRSVCAPVPATAYAGGAATTPGDQLYHCP